MLTDINSVSDKQTSENTINFDEDDDTYKVVNKTHRNYDQFMEARVEAGTRFPGLFSGVAGARRRADSRLGVSRIPLLDIAGAAREGYYQQRLLLSLAWWCSTPVESVVVEGKAVFHWVFNWSPPSPEVIGGAQLEPETITISSVSSHGFSFEDYCKRLEVKFGEPELGVLCACCIAGASNDTCVSCMCCIGWHNCSKLSDKRLYWKAGTLHAGRLDVQRVLYNLHRRQIPTDALKAKADDYVASGYMNEADSELIIKTICDERGQTNIVNDEALDGDDPVNPGLSRRLSPEEIEAKLVDNIEKMKAGGEVGVETDQYRVFKFITNQLEHGESHLRLMVQASAGTGKSFLLTTVFLWSVVRGIKTKACAPTGIQPMVYIMFPNCAYIIS